MIGVFFTVHQETMAFSINPDHGCKISGRVNINVKSLKDLSGILSESKSKIIDNDKQGIQTDKVGTSSDPPTSLILVN